MRAHARDGVDTTTTTIKMCDCVDNNDNDTIDNAYNDDSRDGEDYFCNDIDSIEYLYDNE